MIRLHLCAPLRRSLRRPLRRSLRLRRLRLLVRYRVAPWLQWRLYLMLPRPGLYFRYFRLIRWPRLPLRQLLQWLLLVRFAPSPRSLP